MTENFISLIPKTAFSVAMIISISGTPGTGKTGTARILAKLLDARMISISSLARKKKIRCGYDKKLKCKIIDTGSLQKAVDKEISKKTNIIESHLAHLLKADFVIILRSNPAALEKRLKRRKWSEKKIMDNVHAEILDEITIEALQRHGKSKIIEIDTSKKTPKQAALLIERLLNNFRLQKSYRAGKTDWTEKYMNYLIK